MKELRGKVAVVTGAGSGLGRAMAQRLAGVGMTAVVADIRSQAAESVAEAIEQVGGRAVAAEVDVTKRDSVESLASKVEREFGGTTVLINNAGVVSCTPVSADEEDGWRWIVDVNLFGVVYGLQSFLPRMLERGEDAHVVNVASLAGVVGGGGLQANRITLGVDRPDLGAMYGYMATKHAVVAISETLARDLSGSPIGVSVLCPSHHENTSIFENSARFRPATRGGPMTDEEVRWTMGRADEQREETYGRGVRKERQAEECAARVLRAIREGHFYVFTHPETRAAVEHRFSQLLAGYDDAASFEEEPSH